MKNEIYEVVIHHEHQQKRLFTKASSEEEAGTIFSRFLICQWDGYPWDSPETFLAGVFDKFADGDII